MIKKVLSFVLVSTLVISNIGCKSNSSSFKKISGVEYQLVKEEPGKKPQMGDIMEISIVLKVRDKSGKDTVIAESAKLNNGKPVPIQIRPAQQRIDWQAALAVMTPGDSAIIRVSVDSIMKAVKQPLPPFMKAGSFMIYEVKVFAIKSQDDYKKEMQDKQKEQAGTDEKMIQDYLTKNNIKAQKTESGVYYTVSKEGSGEKIAKGQTISMMYTGKTLDGKVFDSNQDTAFKHNQPLTFKVGFGSVIPGMDEGIGMLKKDAKATLYIPSTLGYGERAQPNIPANSILVFDVDITDVKSENK